MSRCCWAKTDRGRLEAMMRPRTGSIAAPAITWRVVLMILAIAGSVGAAEDRTAGLVYGDGYSFLVTPPPGWILDNHAGVDQGLYAVLYPEGKTWENATTAMYVNTAERKRGARLEEFVASDAKDFSRQVGGRVQVKAMPPLALASGAKAPVRLFAGDRWGNHEAVAYVESPTVF